MMEDEQEKLLSLFCDERRWCQDAEACDDQGRPVRFDDARAASWDITGALCRLFGWRRASVLFDQLHRHIEGEAVHWRFDRDPHIANMAALQDYNDREGMTFQELIGKLRSMPVRKDRATP
jgi:hypothetical protein